MSSTASLTIAGWQTAGTPGDVSANLAALDEAAGRACGREADLLVTPEMFLTGYNIGDQLQAVARGDLVGQVCDIARRHGLAMVVGAPDVTNDATYNAAHFIDETGEVLATYRKSHLFGDLDRVMFSAGDQPFAAVDWQGLRIAMMICYDVEFPETVRAAALDGAQLVVVPTAQMEPYFFIAEQLVRVRAWENQVYVAYVNHCGVESDLTYVGRSSIVGPDATVLDSVTDGEGLVCAAIDLERVAELQKENPYLRDLRRDLF